MGVLEGLLQFLQLVAREDRPEISDIIIIDVIIIISSSSIIIVIIPSSL